MPSEEGLLNGRAEKVSDAERGLSASVEHTQIHERESVTSELP